MNCQDARKAILLDDAGELGANRCRDKENHLAGCPACRTYASDISQLKGMIQDSAPIASSALIERVLAAGARQRGLVGGLERIRYMRMTLSLAAGLVLCLGVWTSLRVLSGNRQPAQTPLGRRIAAVSEFMYAMTQGDIDPEEDAQSVWPTADLETLAEQILATQGLDMDFAAEFGEGVTQREEHLPTTLRWHNTRGLPSERCG